MAEQNLNVRVSLSGIQSVTNGLKDLQLRIAGFSRGLTGAALGLAGAGGLGAALVGATRTGINFNATLEQARLGIAAVQKAVMPGAFKTFDSALAASSRAIELLKVKAKESPATFEELVDGFQSLTGAATEAGIPLENQIDLITTLSNAVSGLGLPSYQLTQESRALLTGNITRDAVVARRLGITPEDINAAKQAGTLYEFLTEKLKAFAEAGERGKLTFTTLSSNIKDAFTQAAAAATFPIFQKFKEGMAEILKADWEAAGRTIGDYLAVGISSWQKGSFNKFVAVSLSAAFEESVQRLGELLREMFSNTGGLGTFLTKTFVQIGFEIRKLLTDAVWGAMTSAWAGLAWLTKKVGTQAQTERAEASLLGVQEDWQKDVARLLGERDAAFKRLGIGWGVGRGARDELAAMVREQARDREKQSAVGDADASVTRLPDQVVRGSANTKGKLDPTSFGDTFRMTLASLQNEWGTWAMQTANVFKTVFESSIASISDGITGLIMQTKTWGQALQQIGVSILTTVVQSIVQMGVRWVLTRIMMATIGRAIGAAELAATLGMNAATASALSAIWAAPAALATTASFGGAATAAPGIISASIAATKGIAIVSQVGGMATGGLTPGRPSLTFVGEEGPEFVVNADATRRNLGVLRAINSGANLRPASNAPRGGDDRPVNVNVFMDRSAWMEANRDEIEAIAIDAFRRNR